jgi:hypothetical protein
MRQRSIIIPTRPAFSEFELGLDEFSGKGPLRHR